MYFSQVCRLHKASCTWCPTLWITDRRCAHPASHSPQHLSWLGKKRETSWVERHGKSACQLPSRAKETLIYCQLKLHSEKQSKTVKHHPPFLFLHTFTPDSSAFSSGNGGQSVTAIVGSAVPAPASAWLLFMSCSAFGIKPVWVLLGNACLLLWIPPGAARNPSSGSTSSPSSCFQLGVQVTAAHFFPPSILSTCAVFFCPTSDALSQRCPCLAAGLSPALCCVGCMQHRAALASPHRGSCRPHSV